MVDAEDRSGEDLGLGGGDGGGRGDEEEVANGEGDGSVKTEEERIENEGVPGFADAPESKQRLGREPGENVMKEDFVWKRIRHVQTARRRRN